MDLLPTDIQRSAQGLDIKWSDGTVTSYSASNLREVCPCATCREKRKGHDEKTTAKPLALPVLAMAEAQATEVTGMRPVGNYAYCIAFSDGHDTGVFTFDFLREIGKIKPAI